MILIGDENIPFESISTIKDEKDIEKTLPNSTVFFNFNIMLMKYSQTNDVAFGVIVNSIKDAIYSNALGAKYIICKKEIAKQIQEIATNYMFDSRILAIIEKNSEIEEIALDNIDGTIYRNILKDLQI